MRLLSPERGRGMTGPLEPSAALLAKLGSIAVHAEEMLEPLGHGFDRLALLSVLQDPDVQEWLEGMRGLAMLPVKRTDRS
jgi:hypothetical protein